jgi:hypothetical protein
MKKTWTYVVLEDGKPICVADDFKYIRQYLDDYCGVNREKGRFVKYDPHNSKYPDDYQGQFIYNEFWSTKDGIKEETLYFKVYLTDLALPTKEQAREDNIDEILK